MSSTAYAQCRIIAWFTGSGATEGLPTGTPMSASSCSRRSGVVSSVIPFLSSGSVSARRGPHVAGCPRHQEPGHGDDVPLKLVGAAAEGVDHSQSVGVFQVALERGVRPGPGAVLADDVEQFTGDLLRELGAKDLCGRGFSHAEPLGAHRCIHPQVPNLVWGDLGLHPCP